ncbi:nuclear transport factor 2 family protein [Paraburkholderia hospita]|uniref:nuclear transport factor 2 family protein n=1 Tax=Paraburkholderia hospita TaxID=169430 RepID=UPI000DEFEFFA|nr:nuclear transport factor 2 family protein [Paraburkholderia hospita]AXF06289.1 hypothetical protein CUJ88_49610 [Paraburkholderia hospita]
MSENQDTIQEIQQCEDARYAAMLSKDVGTLERLLDERLIYVHSTGVADTTISYIEGLVGGIWDYQKIDRTESRIEIDNDTALVFSKLTIQMITRGTFKVFGSRALAVWVRRTDGWRLLAVQSGSIPGEP